MHEWALAESIITATLREAKKENLKTILEIKIGIGELQQIEQDVFEFGLNEQIKSSYDILKNVKIKIVTIKSEMQCKNCNNIWKFSDIKKKLNEEEGESIHFIPEIAFVHMRCPKCKSPDFEIKSGRGISIISIKGEK